MDKPMKGIACAGCPHRAAYVVTKDALGRGRGRVICGDAGCAAVGALHPAATACPGGQERLLPRYNKPVPAGTANEPGSEACVRFVRAEQVVYGAAPDGEPGFSAAEMAGCGRVAVLAVTASSAAYVEDAALSELVDRLRELGYGCIAMADPFDTLGSGELIGEALAADGVSAVVFASPCARLTRRVPLAPAEVDRYSCVGCQRCVQILGCPALSFAPPAAAIDADACAGCDLCRDYCRTHVILSVRARMTPEERRHERYASARGSYKREACS